MRQAVRGTQTGPTSHLTVNANGILREVATLDIVQASLLEDVACIQETKFLFVETAKLKGRHDGGLIIYIRATMAFSAIYPVAGTSNVLEKSAVAIQLPGQQKNPG